MPVAVGTGAAVRSRHIDAPIFAGVTTGSAFVQIHARARVRCQSEADRTRADETAGRVPAGKLARIWLSGTLVDVQAFRTRSSRFETLRDEGMAKEKSGCKNHLNRLKVHSVVALVVVVVGVVVDVIVVAVVVDVVVKAVVTRRQRWLV